MSKTPPRKPLHEWFLESYPEEKITPDTHIKNPMFQQWIPIEQELPDIDQIVWLYNGNTHTAWVGGRAEDNSDDEYLFWLWGNSYGSFWHNGERWTGDIELDDDYQPTHWLPLPEVPVKEEA